MTKTAIENKKIAESKAASIRDADAKRYAADMRFKGSKYSADKSRATGRGGNIIKGIEAGFHGVHTMLNEPASIVGNIVSSKGNDASWYKEIKGIDYSVNYSDFFPNGSVLHEDDMNDTDWSCTSVMALYVVPTFGGNRNVAKASADNDATLGTNPLNLSAVEYQTTLRANNSRVGEYEPGDLMQVTVCGIDLHRRYYKGVKAIAIAQTFKDDLVDIGDKMLIAMGADPKSFRAHLPEFKSELHRLRDDIEKSIHLPADIHYYQKVMMLESAVYADENAVGPQIYLFENDTRMVYNETDARVDIEHGETIAYGSSGFSFINSMDADLTKLKYSAVLTTMWSDIKEGLNKEATLPDFNDAIKIDKFLQIDELLQQVMNSNLPLVLKYNDSGIDRIKVSRTNGFISPFFSFIFSALQIRQNSSGILYQGHQNSVGVKVLPKVSTDLTKVGSYTPCFPYHVVGQAADEGNPLKNPVTLNFYKPDFTNDDKLVASRLTTIYRSYPIQYGASGATFYLNIETSGDHSLCGIRIVKSAAVPSATGKYINIDIKSGAFIKSTNWLTLLTKVDSGQTAPATTNVDLSNIEGSYVWENGKTVDDMYILKILKEFNYHPNITVFTKFVRTYNGTPSVSLGFAALDYEQPDVAYYTPKQFGSVVQVSVINLYPINRLAMKSLFQIPVVVNSSNKR